MLSRLRSRRPGPRQAGGLGAVSTGDYLTDGQRLYRCLLSDRRAILMLEDCESLTLLAVDPDRLARRPMRVVRAPGNDAAANAAEIL